MECFHSVEHRVYTLFLLQHTVAAELDEGSSSILSLNDPKSLPKVDTNKLEETTKQTKSVT